MELVSGSSVSNTSVESAPYNVACQVVVENRTNCSLTSPASFVNGGVMKYPPVVVPAGHREAFLAHKIGFTATGTYGTASWLIPRRSEKTEKRLVVMWSVPFNHDFYSNWLAVGFATPADAHHDWYKQMYYKESKNGLNFVRGEFDKSIQTIYIEDGDIRITGTMGTSHKTQVSVIVNENI